MKKKCLQIQTSPRNNKRQLVTFEELETSFNDEKNQIEKMKFREQEECEIFQFIQSKEEQKFLMITGQPGSGKTMLLQKLRKQWQQKYHTIYLNAMQCKNYIDFLQICKKELKIRTQSTNLQLKTKIIEKLSEQNVIIIVDEFDHLFKISEQEAFDLFTLSKQAVIIGISNDIEFLQSQSAKYKFQLPKYKNVILKPYTILQIQELVIDRLKQLQEINYDENSIKLLTTRAYNDKGGDMRNVIDILKRILANKTEITTETINQEIGMTQNDNKMKIVVTNFSLHQQLILIGLIALQKKDPQKLEFDQQDIIRKVNEIKFKMGLKISIDVTEELEVLKDYNVLTIKEVKQQKMGFKLNTKKVQCKFTADELKYQLSDVDALKNILQQL